MAGVRRAYEIYQGRLVTGSRTNWPGKVSALKQGNVVVLYEGNVKVGCPGVRWSPQGLCKQVIRMPRNGSDRAATPVFTHSMIVLGPICVVWS